MGPSHRLAGAVAWLAVAPTLHLPAWQIITGAIIAGTFAHGRLSPDMDRYPILEKLIPGGHRGITHWWLLPAAGYAAYHWAVSTHPDTHQWLWMILAVIVAWASHIATDFVFGRIPVLPRRHGWQYAGLGFKTGGLVEQAIAMPAFLIIGVWLVINYPV